MIEKNHPTKRYGKTVAVDQPVPQAQRPKAFTWTRIVALMVTIVLLTGLTYLGVSSSPETVSVPQGAHAGQLTMHPCTYSTENGGYRADCGTLVVPEDRANPRSRLIALPVTRILARSSHPLAPIFHLNGGPGTTNMTFPQANRLAAQHDVVMVGYRGVDGSSVLNCPEVTAALENSADYLGKASLSAYSQAFASCAQRLERSGVDLAGYTLAEQADDIEAARVALGYKRIDLLSESAGTRLAMIYAWRYPNSVDRSVMIGVNPPGNFLYSGAEIDQGIERYSALCAQQPACRARTGNLAASMQHTAADMPSRWYFLPIKPGNVLVATLLGLQEATSVDSPLSGPMTLDSWISAAQGDPSGLWLLSLMADLTLPQSFVWGEFASIGMADAQPAERYFSSGAGGGSIIGNPFDGVLVWGRRPRARLAGQPGREPVHQRAELERPDAAHRRDARLRNAGPERHEGAAAAPSQRASGHPVRARARGRLLVLRAESRHAAADHVLRHRPGRHVPLHPERGQLRHIAHSDAQTAIAKDILAAMIGFAALAALWLLWVARRVRKHGAAGPKTSFATRTIVPLVLGLGGWLGAALVVLTLWPALSLTSELLGILAVSVPIALGLYLAWTHRDWDRGTKSLGLLAATAGALLGGWLGFTATSGLFAIVTTTIGAAAAGNLALIALSLFRERSARSHGNDPAATYGPPEHSRPGRRSRP